MMQLGSEFVFDPARWSRDALENDFRKLGKLFNAERSVVRVPDLDPNYKIAVFASKQVCHLLKSSDFYCILTKLLFVFASRPYKLVQN